MKCPHQVTVWDRVCIAGVTVYLFLFMVLCTVLSLYPPWREEIRAFFGDPYEFDAYLKEDEV